jgi:hypothetical protein
LLDGAWAAAHTRRDPNRPEGHSSRQDGHTQESGGVAAELARAYERAENVARLRRHLNENETGITISRSMFRREGDPENAQTPEFLKRDFPGLAIWSDYVTRWPGFDVEKSTATSTGCIRSAASASSLPGSLSCRSPTRSLPAPPERHSQPHFAASSHPVTRVQRIPRFATSFMP